jgi:hypothetical protein
MKMAASKLNKETLVGIAAMLVIVGTIATATGWYGILYLGFAYVLVVISLKLFFRKSIAAKTGAVILNTDIAYKILMPSKYKKAVKELRQKELQEPEKG